MELSVMKLSARHLNYNPCLTLQARLAESASCAGEGSAWVSIGGVVTRVLCGSMELKAEAGMEGALVPRPVKERKKHDRFNGMSEEEVSRRTLPDHLAENLDIIIVSMIAVSLSLFTL
ncbi:hypothetical protein HW555_011046 [Spodoptera exigua]|uniref:Uncharacterized protein n=1 Tax=Spodoptera exigua TaxID=7107 RepID=A0A835G9W3_SPOEX|nr:hypothetical protein HW555_011046 [Spodoptera exigua]